MKKIIILISLCSVITLHAADNGSASSSYGLISGADYKLKPSHGETAELGQTGALSPTDYSLFDNDQDANSAWVGIAGKYGELKLGSHNSLDNLAITGADQQRYGGAYDLLIQDDTQLSRSVSYLNKSGVVSVGAQVATEDSDDKKTSTGLLLNAQSRSVEAAIGYRRTIDESKAVKGRLTYKSRNNSRVRVDLVAEKVAIDDASTSALADSTSFMLGAKYSMTPKSYVVGQYGVVGFDVDANLSVDELTESKDYNALSLEAGYSLSDKTSFYINHTQKSFDSQLQLPFAESSDEGSQTNSIGVRLNW